jgi:IS30 family transposase
MKYRWRIFFTDKRKSEISDRCQRGESLRSIARSLKHSASTICREVRCNDGVRQYRATVSDQAAWDRALRPKICQLACHLT